VPTFHHKRVATFQDAQGVWARFSPAERVVDGREVRFGVLETDDAELVRRLRAATLRDPDLVEVDAPVPEPEPEPETPAEPEPEPEPADEPKPRTRSRARGK